VGRGRHRAEPGHLRQAKWITPVAKRVALVVKEVAEEGKELVSSITSGLSSMF
jgi:hypothetical protein